MNAASKGEPPVGNGPHQDNGSVFPKAVPDYMGRFTPFGEARASWVALLLDCLATGLNNVSGWPPLRFITLATVGALTFAAHQILAAREALGPVVTITGVLATVLPTSVIGVIALLKNETTDKRTEDPPQPRDERGGPTTT